MIYYKNTDNKNIIFPTSLDVNNDDNQESYKYERKINIFYLRLLFEQLTKIEFNIFLKSIDLILNDSPGYPLYYGYHYYYNKSLNCCCYYTIKDIYEILSKQYSFNENDLIKTFDKLIHMHVIIPKKSYISLDGDVDDVLFLNDLLLNYENSGIGISDLHDLKYDDKNIVILDSFCEINHFVFCPIESKKIPQSQINRNSKQSREWVLKVKERANYTCECCGSTELKGISSHHIQSWAIYEELRYDLSNGVCLCDNCHNPFTKGSFHNTYGTRNNTPQQLLEYIKNKRMELNIIDKSFIKSPFLLEHINEI